MRVVGISTAHDASVAVYNDGEIEFFLKEERLTRTKRDNQPFTSMVEVVNFLNGKKVDAVAISSPIATDQYVKAIMDCASKIFKTKNIYDMSSTHHLCHASLAFYNSGFEESIILVVDRNGSLQLDSRGLALESETVFLAKYPNNFKEIRKNYWSNALGANFDHNLKEAIQKEKASKTDCLITCESLYGITKVYESATALIGENLLENGKTMGLAAYGKDNVNFENLFLENCQPVDSLFTHIITHRGDVSATMYKKYINKITTSLKQDDYQFYADYAYQVQKQTQEQVLKLIQWAIDKTGIKNVCVSGGYGLNVVANGYYVSKFPNVNFFFEPLADDTGNSLGAAMFLYRQLTQDAKIRPIKSTFFQGEQPNLNIKNISKNVIEKISYKKVKTNFIIDALLSNKSVAIFSGKAEAGPRSLGNRSILFYPTLSSTKDIINKIKKREWYRPFAGCVLEEDAQEYFEMMNIKSSPYMTISFAAKQKTKDLFPGIVHVDGSCRVQTVKEDNENLYELLKDIKKKTGHGILLNTSFNLAGEPLVDSLQQAIDVLINSSLDFLWTPDNKIIYQKHYN